jgi:hypothetical protein
VYLRSATFSHAVEASVETLVRESDFSVPRYQAPSNRTTQTTPVFVPPRDEREKLRVSRLTLLILVAATATVAGYFGYGLITGGENGAHSVATSEGSAASNNGAPPQTTDPSTSAGTSTALADDRNGGESPVMQAPIGATTISDPEQEDTEYRPMEHTAGGVAGARRRRISCRGADRCGGFRCKTKSRWRYKIARPSCGNVRTPTCGLACKDWRAWRIFREGEAGVEAHLHAAATNSGSVRQSVAVGSGGSKLPCGHSRLHSNRGRNGSSRPRRGDPGVSSDPERYRAANCNETCNHRRAACHRERREFPLHGAQQVLD